MKLKSLGTNKLVTVVGKSGKTAKMTPAQAKEGGYKIVTDKAAKEPTKSNNDGGGEGGSGDDVTAETIRALGTHKSIDEFIEKYGVSVALTEGAKVIEKQDAVIAALELQEASA